MLVTQRYKTAKAVTKDWAVLIGGTLLMCSGPILDALGWLRG
jgi:hypothetical protein